MKQSKVQRKKSFRENITYAYIRKIKKWMFCPACQEGKMTINKKSTLWTCEECGYNLFADEFEDDYVFWFCDECKTYLNTQDGFDRYASRHICKNCGYENDTTVKNLKGICSDCGKIIPDPDGTLCADCRQDRRDNAKEWVKTAGIVAGVIAVSAGIAYHGSHSSDSERNKIYTYIPNGSDDEDGIATKCANCGNIDENTLWDEGDTVYCSKCCHRTSTKTKKDDSVECPYCHRMRDRKAMYCRWCNDSTWEASTRDEFKEIDKILKDMGH